MRFWNILGWSINDSLTLVGAGMVFWGLYQWWPPLAWMAAGSALVWLGLTRQSME